MIGPLLLNTFDGKETKLKIPGGPRHVLWTRELPPEQDGVRFGESKRPGVRHLRIGWKEPLTVGSVLVRGGGQLSVLKPDAAYPNDMSDESQWIPAQRIKDRQVSCDEVHQEEYAVWVLPPGTTTRALRFTHRAQATETSFTGWLGGAYVLRQRVANIAPQAFASASATEDIAGRINNENNDGTWKTWDNGPEGARHKVSGEHPEWLTLVWPRGVRVSALGALWAGFGAATRSSTWVRPIAVRVTRARRIGKRSPALTASKTVIRRRWALTGSISARA